MTTGSQIPLGQRIPNALHAVSVSIPTFADVIGYEEKRPETMAKLRSGYPRFVIHECLREIEAYWQELFDCRENPIWLTSSEGMAKALQAYLNSDETTFIRHRQVCGLRLPPDPDLNNDAKQFLRHVGGMLSSRAAEDYLLAEGLRPAAALETLAPSLDEADATCRRVLAPLFETNPDDCGILFANSGMNAFYAAFQAINAIQAPQGRHSWIKLGWLYTDTMEILAKLSPPEADNAELLDVFNLDALENLLAARGDSFAGLITEAPTNPMIQTPDLARIRQLATQHGVYLVIDPTVNSPANVDVTPYADVIPNSLTKYAANEGDVIAGILLATDNCPERERFLELAQAHLEPVYPRDLRRLAAQIEAYPDFVERANRNAAQVIPFLEQHPKVKKVYWSREPASAAHYDRVARRQDAVGALISFELEGPLQPFLDRLALPKGPSFGMASSLVCPFIYLAHYDLVTTPDGQALLALAGIPPELVRLSIGLEPAEDLIAALRAALD